MMEKKPNPPEYCCLGKVRHPDRAEAARIMRSVMGRKTTPGEASVYKCPHCGSYHWGHSFKGQKKA